MALVEVVKSRWVIVRFALWAASERYSLNYTTGVGEFRELRWYINEMSCFQALSIALSKPLIQHFQCYNMPQSYSSYADISTYLSKIIIESHEGRTPIP